MKAYTMCSPIVSGKVETWKAFNKELSHARKTEFDSMMKRCGISRTRTWLQKTPQGEMAFALHEGSSPDRMMSELAKANDPFCTWFKGKMKECHGIDVEAGGTGFMVTEQSMDCTH